MAQAKDQDVPRVSACDVIATNAATGDGANPWGGHQNRIARTVAGVFVAYTVAGSDNLHRRWRLAWRAGEGRWETLAEGASGREPMNLMAAPDGTELGEPVSLDLRGHAVEYSGMGIAAPRGGTPPGDVVDAVFPADKGKTVVYVRIQFNGNE